MEGIVGKIDFHAKAYVCTHILTGERPVLLVDRGNGDWCFLCGADHEDIPENFRVGGIGHIVERDPTLNEILDLPSDFEAEREIVGGPWIRMRKTDEGGEPH